MTETAADRPLPPLAADGSRIRDWLAKSWRDPAWPLRTGRALARAGWDLRACDAVGARPRLFGRCLVANDGRIVVGDRLLMYGATVRCELVAHAGGELEIGDGVFINYGSSISAHRSVRLGDRCLIGQYAIIMDCDYHAAGDPESHGEPRPVVIGPGAWLGARVTVLKGVTIGAGAVIAAGSVVVRDVPDGALAAGVPARVLRAGD